MDNFLKNFFNDSPVYFAEAPTVPKDVQEAAAAASGTEGQQPGGLQPEAAQTKLGEIIQRGKEGQVEQGDGVGEKGERRKRTQEARGQLKDADKKTKETTDELAKHDTTGELRDFVRDQSENAESRREQKLGEIGEKADDKRDAAVENAKDQIKKVDGKLAKAFDEFYKSLGNLAKDALKQFLKMATNIVNSMRSMLAGKIEGHYANKADKYAAKAKDARFEDNSNRAEMLDARGKRAMETSRNVRAKGNEYYYLAHSMRGQANRLRAQRTDNAETAKQNVDLTA